MKAPFPYFGGKSTIAKTVWNLLGDVNRYIEPFFGSGSVLLNRPGWKPDMDEIVCDKDGFIANVWRSIQFSPDEVAKWCDWPINHADLSARKMALIKNEDRLLENLINDERWHDPVMAGYWIWAASCWIGSGLTGKQGVHALGKRPHITAEQGVHALGKRPHLDGRAKTGLHAVTDERIYTWMNELSQRLRYVKVVCGDWSRVCGGNWQGENGVCGVYFDPPYSSPDRDKELYHSEDLNVAREVAKWALERGKSNKYRIVISGYYDEHEWLLNEGWSVIRWSAQGGYSDQKRNKNRHKESIFISPYCVGQQVFDFKEA